MNVCEWCGTRTTGVCVCATKHGKGRRALRVMQPAQQVTPGQQGTPAQDAGEMAFGCLIILGVLALVVWGAVAGIRGVTAEPEEPTLQEQCQQFIDQGDNWINDGAPLDDSQPNDRELGAWYQCKKEFG